MPFNFRRKSKTQGGLASADNTAGSDSEKHDQLSKRSLLDFFKSSRRKHKTQGEEKDQNITLSTPAPTLAKEKEIALTNEARPTDTLHQVEEEPGNLELNEEDIQKLFSGAPQFFLDIEYDQIRPRVAFPDDFTLNIRDVSDSKLLDHVAFSGATLRQHLPGPGARRTADWKAIVYDIGVVEMPSMLSATGNELGTVGFDHFLQEPMADTNHPSQGDGPEEVFENFSNFELLESQPEKLGIRQFELSVVAERLAELTEVYKKAGDNGLAANILKQSSPGDLYAALFGKVLTPPKYDGNTEDPMGLKVQIESLIRVLNLKRIWYDFSNVEWRIRIGQLLFLESSLNVSDDNLSEPEDGLSEREVVVLQILLSCELYARLDAVSSLSLEELSGTLHLTKAEVDNFRELESRKTRWDLVLACRFLGHVDVKTFTRSRMVSNSGKSLARSFSNNSAKTGTVQVDELDIAFLPRKQDQQLDGLYHFAKSIAWPDREAFESNLSSILSGREEDMMPAAPSIYTTPLSTPGSLTPRSFRSGQGSSYFARGSPEMTPRSFQLQPPSPLSLDASTDSNHSGPHIGGWLTRSYLVGLVMPGEAISHLLISSILENDAESIAALGENANLYGGFVYKGRSFWSKSCIVGRVLACLDDSAECMGWISSSTVPKGFENGWVDVQCSPMSRGERDQHKIEERLSSGTEFLAQKSDVQYTDLTLPQDVDVSSKHSVHLDALLFTMAEGSIEASTSDVTTTSATLNFSLTTDHSVHAFGLCHLVQFVSAYPCTPPQLSALKRIRGESIAKMAPAHPLHSSQKYEIVHVTDLMNDGIKISSRECVSVIDARGDCISELLARAWCSSVGENCLIAKVGVTCLACAVREARGLGLQVIVRVGSV